MCTYDIKRPFEIKKRAMSKVTPGWKHVLHGDFGHVKLVHVVMYDTKVGNSSHNYLIITNVYKTCHE